MKKLVLLITVALFGICSAQEAPKVGPPVKAPPVPEKVFAKMDTNQDGLISAEEFKAFHGNQKRTGPPVDRRHKGEKSAGSQKPAVSKK